MITLAATGAMASFWNGKWAAATALAVPALALAQPAWAQDQAVPAPAVSAPVPVQTAPQVAPDGAAPPSEPSEQEEAPGIVVQGDAYSRQDPVHAVNEKSYEAIQKGDKLVVAPVARLYAHGVPSPLRRGLHNALYNLREPSNFVAFLLEHKFGKAGQVLVRFTVNSTIGLAGLIDVAKAKPLKIPTAPTAWPTWPVSMGSSRGLTCSCR
ncbi:MlaA family lipoprotein [Novosphingobium pokkalii]|uniref:MlaA family lipoprotein n=1 Tax=Novosphingobium pokkalii TaxID=1770194 RepID=UPI0036274452